MPKKFLIVPAEKIYPVAGNTKEDIWFSFGGKQDKKQLLSLIKRMAKEQQQRKAKRNKK